MKITKATVSKWLAYNHPDLCLHTESSLDAGKGYFNKSQGAAQSYRGFRTWRMVAIALGMIAPPEEGR